LQPRNKPRPGENPLKHLTPFEVISLYPQHGYTLQSLFETRALTNPAKPFIIFKDQRWTWNEFSDAIERTARMLLARGMARAIAWRSWRPTATRTCCVLSRAHPGDHRASEPGIRRRGSQLHV
jgi:hypothetical protein